MGVIGCGYSLWIAIKNNSSTITIWNIIADLPKSYIQAPDVFLSQN